MMKSPPSPRLYSSLGCKEGLREGGEDEVVIDIAHSSVLPNRPPNHPFLSSGSGVQCVL